jgi:hypothetical protein
MNCKIFSLTIIIAAALFALPLQAFGWGCSRSFSASGRYGGSVSHSGSTSGGWGGWSHSGSTTVSGRYGNSYTTNRSASGNYYGGYGYGGYHYGGYYGGGFAAGAVAGAAVGAANTAAATCYNPYAPGVCYRPVW